MKNRDNSILCLKTNICYTTVSNHEQLDEKELTSALNEFDPIWEALNPRERIRLIHLIVKRIDYHGGEGMLNITFHETGIKKLTEEISLA